MKWTDKALVIGGLLLFAVASMGAALTPIGFNDCSGTITLGGTAQQLLAANTRTQFLIQNDSTDPLAFSATSTTPAVNGSGSWTLTAAGASAPGGSYGPNTFTFGSGAIFIIGATTGDAFSCHWR